jgi:PadR family transcriptional regulator, regulatory protein PadR
LHENSLNTITPAAADEQAYETKPFQSSTSLPSKNVSCPTKKFHETFASPKRLMDERGEFGALYANMAYMKDKRENPGDLLQGTLDLLILKALARGAMHGYGVAEWIHQTSEDILKVEEGALYPALHRLELRGLLSSEWGTSDNNRRAKFYSLTAAGKKELAQETEFWRRMSGAVARILQTA